MQEDDSMIPRKVKEKSLKLVANAFMVFETQTLLFSPYAYLVST